MTKLSLNPPVQYLSTDSPYPTIQKCACGETMRVCEFGVDYTEVQRNCQKCGGSVYMGSVTMIDRFSGLERIFAEHRIAGIFGYEHSRLPHPPNFPIEEEEFDDEW